MRTCGNELLASILTFGSERVVVKMGFRVVISFSNYSMNSSY